MSLPKGFKHSPETLAKMSVSAKRRDIKFVPEYRAKISATLRGHSVGQKTRKKISKALRGHTISPEASARGGMARRGANNSNWKGGKNILNGYVALLRRDHPFSGSRGYIYEHRLVMEAHLNRILLPNEIVHHINGNNMDNRIENLMLFSSNKEHLGYHKDERKKGNFK